MTAIFINNRKILDVARFLPRIMKRLHNSKIIIKKNALSGPARHETWNISHNCNLNYTGFSPGIQTAGANKIFSSSKEKHGLYYTSFYGHSDSKACPAVKDIYGPTKLI